MENGSQSSLSSEKTEVNDPEFFAKVKMAIEKNLEELKKVVDNLSQMRVEAAYLESDLISTIDAASWTQISEIVGVSAMNIHKLQDNAFDKGTQDMHLSK